MIVSVRKAGKATIILMGARKMTGMMVRKCKDEETITLSKVGKLRKKSIFENKWQFTHLILKQKHYKMQKGILLIKTLPGKRANVQMQRENKTCLKKQHERCWLIETNRK